MVKKLIFIILSSLIPFYFHASDTSRLQKLSTDKKELNTAEKWWKRNRKKFIGGAILGGALYLASNTGNDSQPTIVPRSQPLSTGQPNSSGARVIHLRPGGSESGNPGNGSNGGDRRQRVDAASQGYVDTQRQWIYQVRSCGQPELDLLHAQKRLDREKSNWGSVQSIQPRTILKATN